MCVRNIALFIYLLLTYFVVIIFVELVCIIAPICYEQIP